MNGEFDTCEGKLNALYYCMKNKVVNDPELAEVSPIPAFLI